MYLIKHENEMDSKLLSLKKPSTSQQSQAWWHKVYDRLLPVNKAKVSCLHFVSFLP